MVLLGRASCVALLFLALAQRAYAQRKLLQQTALDCTQVHPQCLSCVPESLNVATRVICTACTSPQYQAINDTCGCSPGHFVSNSAQQTCSPCGKGAYCPGGLAPTALRHMCGELLTSDFATAADEPACITLPGVAYMQGGATAAACPAGSYNMGGNRRNCTECPYGLTTAGTGATYVEVCSSPPGYFFRSRQALPCAVGTYKSGINKDAACQSCPVGTTTNSTAAKSAQDCSIGLPGYQPLHDDITGLMIGAEPCPVGTYSPYGSQCLPCPEGLTTQLPKQTDLTSCLAPPGYGYYANTTNTAGINVSSGSVVACPDGTFKSGWSLESCVTCGLGLATDPVPATTPDQCYLRAGYGSKHVMANVATADSVQMLVATKCMSGTYGSEDRRFGLEAMPCQPCPEYTATPDLAPDLVVGAAASMLMTSISNCSNIPGYGWQNGLAVQCPTGYYSPGFDLRPCAECGNGQTTDNPGATREQDCMALPGWQLTGLAAAEVCPTGTWSSGGSAPCTTCPTGSTTAGPAATAATDCSVCSAGWGGVDNLITSQGPVMCAPCTYGSYSPGGTSNPCIACEQGYTSPARAADTSACYPQWSAHNPHTWIPSPSYVLVPASAVVASINAAQQMPSAANSTAANTANLAAEPTGAVLEAAESPFTRVPTDAAACQALCGTDAGCQYYVFKSSQQDTSQDGCWYKLQTSTPTPNTYISYRLGTGDYVIWPADNGWDTQVGNPIEWSSSNPDLKPTTPSSCIDACDTKAACQGTWVSYMPQNATWQCHLLSGEFRNDVVSAFQAVPERINDNRWAKDCIGSWSPFSVCNQTCGGGAQVATYTITQPASGDGAQCAFADGATKSEPCNTQNCPQNCVGSWVWSMCSAECGGGVQTATFSVSVPAADGGVDCEAVDGAMTNQTCNKKPCSNNQSPSGSPLPMPSVNRPADSASGQPSAAPADSTSPRAQYPALHYDTIRKINITEYDVSQPASDTAATTPAQAAASPEPSNLSTAQPIQASPAVPVVDTVAVPSASASPIPSNLVAAQPHEWFATLPAASDSAASNASAADPAASLPAASPLPHFEPTNITNVTTSDNASPASPLSDAAGTVPNVPSSLVQPNLVATNSSNATAPLPAALNITGPPADSPAPLEAVTSPVAASHVPPVAASPAVASPGPRFVAQPYYDPIRHINISADAVLHEPVPAANAPSASGTDLTTGGQKPARNGSLNDVLSGAPEAATVPDSNVPDSEPSSAGIYGSTSTGGYGYSVPVTSIPSVPEPGHYGGSPAGSFDATAGTPGGYGSLGQHGVYGI